MHAMEPSDILRLIRDRFRRAVVDPGEQKLLDELQKLREDERMLRAAADAGEQAQEKLEETRAQAADLVSRLPRGARGLYCALGVLCVLSVGALARVYDRIHPAVVGMWGGQEAWAQNWYLHEYRWGGLHLYQLGHFLTSSSWYHVALASFLVALWLVQRELRRWQARTLLLALVLLHLAVFVLLLFAPFHLLLRPLVV